MEQTILWVNIVGVIVIPLLGWVFNSLITNKIDSSNKRIDDLEKYRSEDKKEFYNQLNGLRQSIEKDYVFQKLYDQEISHIKEKSSNEIKGFLAIVNTQFSNVEDKIDHTNKKIDDTNKNIDEIKKIITDKFNGNKKGD